MIQGFVSLYPNPTETFVKETPNKGFQTFENYEKFSQFISELVLSDMNFFSSMLSKKQLGRLIDVSAKEKNDISRDDFMEWTKSIWTFNAESARRVGHPEPFPIDLPYRLIQLYSFTNDIILDPFMGSGTTGIAALKSNRKYIGFDTSKEYVNLAKNRISPHENTLQFK